MTELGINANPGILNYSNPMRYSPAIEMSDLQSFNWASNPEKCILNVV